MSGSSSTSTAVAKRASENALMPPPPPAKRIKRPTKVLDEDEYTSALSDIIARDFFPGLLESRAQQEYLNALEANDEAWIRSAGRNLTEAMTPHHGRRQARATRLSRPETSQPDATPTYGGETPKGWGGATPSVAGTELSQIEVEASDSGKIDTSNIGLTEFQQKYTSEDNESFYALLDKQNEKKREKYTYLWNNNKILAPRQLLHRAREAKLLEQAPSSDDKSVIPLTTGATDSRPAQPTSWGNTRPDNSLMFNPDGVEDELETIAQKAEAASRAAPKQTVYSNTRFQPPPAAPRGPVPPSPSLSAVRDAIAGRPRLSATEIGSDAYTGAETPRINGYAFVDEDEPEAGPQPSENDDSGPSYRDLLAGQAEGPNPFKISENRKREDLHHRLVEKSAKEKREKKKETIKTPVPKFPSSPMIGGRTPLGLSAGSSIRSDKTGGMTPAARKLMERVGGRTPRRDNFGLNNKDSDSGLKNMWTPTPRRKSQLGK